MVQYLKDSLTAMTYLCYCCTLSMVPWPWRLPLRQDLFIGKCRILRPPPLGGYRTLLHVRGCTAISYLLPRRCRAYPPPLSCSFSSSFFLGDAVRTLLLCRVCHHPRPPRPVLPRVVEPSGAVPYPPQPPTCGPILYLIVVYSSPLLRSSVLGPCSLSSPLFD